MTSHRLAAWVGERPMGTLSYDDQSGWFAFTYNPDWAASGFRLTALDDRAISDRQQRCPR